MKPSLITLLLVVATVLIGTLPPLVVGWWSYATSLVCSRLTLEAITRREWLCVGLLMSSAAASITLIALAYGHPVACWSVLSICSLIAGSIAFAVNFHETISVATKATQPALATVTRIYSDVEEA